MSQDLDEVKRMFTTIMDGHNNLTQRVDGINERLTDIIRIEEKQLATSQAIGRMGSHIDDIHAELRTLQTAFVALQTGDITDLKVNTGKLWMKVSVMGASSGAGAAGVALAILKVSGML
jgi:GTP1/Obg family GTP-binding protein